MDARIKNSTAVSKHQPRILPQLLSLQFLWWEKLGSDLRRDPLHKNIFHNEINPFHLPAYNIKFCSGGLTSDLSLKIKASQKPGKAFHKIVGWWMCKLRQCHCLCVPQEEFTLLTGKRDINCTHCSSLISCLQFFWLCLCFVLRICVRAHFLFFSWKIRIQPVWKWNDFCPDVIKWRWPDVIGVASGTWHQITVFLTRETRSMQLMIAIGFHTPSQIALI